MISEYYQPPQNMYWCVPNPQGGIEGESVRLEPVKSLIGVSHESTQRAYRRLGRVGDGVSSSLAAGQRPRSSFVCGEGKPELARVRQRLCL